MLILSPICLYIHNKTYYDKIRDSLRLHIVLDEEKRNYCFVEIYSVEQQCTVENTYTIFYTFGSFTSRQKCLTISDHCCEMIIITATQFPRLPRT